MKSISTLLLFFVLTSFSSSDLLPTSLKITIVDELGNVVKGADVTLYPTNKDYREETNQLLPQLRMPKGALPLKNLNLRFILCMQLKKKGITMLPVSKQIC